jgi:hypothetical protein
MSGNNRNTRRARKTVASAAKYFENIENTKERQAQVANELMRTFYHYKNNPKGALFKIRDDKWVKNYRIARMKSQLNHYNKLVNADSISRKNAEMLKKNLMNRVNEQKNGGVPSGWAELYGWEDHVEKGPNLERLIMKHLQTRTRGGATRRNRRASRRGTRRNRH